MLFTLLCYLRYPQWKIQSNLWTLIVKQIKPQVCYPPEELDYTSSTVFPYFSLKFLIQIKYSMCYLKVLIILCVCYPRYLQWKIQSNLWTLIVKQIKPQVCYPLRRTGLHIIYSIPLLFLKIPYTN